MKKLTLSVLLFIPFFLYGQITVKGLITEQNSGKKPISGVQLKTLGANPEVSDNCGLFQLVFNAKKPGDKINVIEISKKGFEVVNSKEVNENWLVSNNPDQRTKIIMCPEGFLAQNAAKYYDISLTALTNGYNKRKKELEDKLNNAIIEKAKFEEEAKKLNEQFDNQQNQLEELADKFAHENFDDCSAIQNKAFEAFKMGNIDEAIRILESVNSEAEIEKAKKQKVKGGHLVNEGKNMQAEADSIITQNISKLMFQGQLYEKQFDDSLAEVAYKTAVLADTTNFGNVFVFACFLDKQKQYIKALKWHKTALILANNEYDKATVLNNLAVVLQYVNQFDIAEKYLKDALSIRKSILIKSYKINSDIAETLNNLGDLYKNTDRHDTAEIKYIEALNLIKDLNKSKKEYKMERANTLGKLATIQVYKNQFIKAELNYLEAIGLYREMADQDPQRFNIYIANILIGKMSFTGPTGLAFLQLMKNDFEHAEANFAEAFNILNNLTKNNPYAYNNELASAYIGYGSLKLNLNQYDKAEEYFQKGLKIFKELAITNPQTYNPQVALSQIILATLYQVIGSDSMNKAKIYCIEALIIYRELAINNPHTYNSLIASTLMFLAPIQIGTKQYDNAELTAKEALNLFRKLAEENPEVYNIGVATTLLFLSPIYVEKKQFNLAIKAITEALEIYKKMYNANPQATNYKALVGQTLLLLGSIQQNCGQIKLAEKNDIEASNIYKELSKSHPQYIENYIKVNLELAALQDNKKVINTIGESFSTIQELTKVYQKDSLGLEYYESMFLFLLSTKVNTDLSKNYSGQALNTLSDASKKYSLGLNKTSIIDDLSIFADSLITKKHYNFAEAIYLEVIRNLEILTQKYPQKYSSKLGRKLCNLAVLYDKDQQYENAIIFYKHALSEYKLLLNDSSKSYKLDLVNVYFNLAVLYNITNQYDNSIINSNEALKIYRVLAVDNQKVYGLKIIYTLSALYYSQKSLEKYVEAERNLTEAIDIYKKLLEFEPQNYNKGELALLYFYLASVQHFEKKYDFAIGNCNEALKIYQILAETNPKLYKPIVALIINELSWNQYITDLPEAIKNANESINILQDLVIENPEDKPFLAGCQARMVRYKILNHQFSEAEEYALSSIKNDSTKMLNKKNFAHSLLFLNKYDSALKLYTEIKKDSVYKKYVLSDFDEFEKAGITNPNVAKIRELLAN